LSGKRCLLLLCKRIVFLLVDETEGENFAATMLMQINSTEDHEPVCLVTLALRNHAVLPAADWDLTESGQSFPMVQVNVEDTYVVQGYVSCMFINAVIPAAKDHQELLAALARW